MKYLYNLFFLLFLAFPKLAFAIDPPTITASSQLCAPGGGTVILTATSVAGATIKWFDTQVNGNELGTNPTIITPILTSNTTYYAEATSGSGETSVRQAYLVVVNAQPTISFTLDNNNPCSGSDVHFTSIITNPTGSYQYLWNFGDGATSVLANSTHTFTSVGCGNETFTVTLTVTDSNGCNKTSSQQIIVKQSPDVSFFDPIAAGLDNQFSNCASAAFDPVYHITIDKDMNSSCVSSYSINWGDNSPIEQNVTFPRNHTYTALGAYNLTVTTLGTNGCQIIKTYVVKNVSNPSGGINSPGSTQNLCTPTANIQFTLSNWATNSPGTVYTVDYGDTHIQNYTQEQLVSSIYYNPVSPAASQNYPIPHSFTTTHCPANQFVITLTVTNACGFTTGTIANITTILQSSANFTNPPYGCVNTPITFTNTTVLGYGADCNQPTKYTWNFGDGSPIETVNFTPSTPNRIHTYTTPGTYTITLTAQNGCTITTKTNTICIENPVTPNFTINNNNICAGAIVEPNNVTTTANICNATYNWSVTYASGNCGVSPGTGYNYFTGGTIATSINPKILFPNAGIYTVTLTTQNSCGSLSSSKTITVKNPPTVTITPISNICGGTSATINPTATVADCGGTPLTYAWSFPGGVPTTSSNAIPGTIVYNTPGLYNVTLSVTNECGTTTKTISFNVSPAVIANAGQDATICSGSTILNGVGSGGSNATYSYSWSPTTGLSNSNIATPTASPTVTTTYILTVTNGGCTATDQVTVFVNNLTPGSIGSNQVVCGGIDPSPFTITTPSTGQGILTYQWENSATGAVTNFTNIAGATSDIYDAPVLTQQTWYRRTVTSTLNGVVCTATSNIVNININKIIPGSINGTQTICSGGNPVAFTSVAPIANGAISYQWQSSTDNITFNTIPGATSASYDPAALTTNTWYRRIDTSTLGTVSCNATTNVIAVNLTTPPAITVQPIASQTLCAQATPLTLSVQATGGTIPYTYQWYSNTTNNTTGGILITNATLADFVPPTTAVGTKYYYCVVSSPEAGCTDTSVIAQIIIITAPAISSQPQSQTLCEGQMPALLTVAYQNGTGTPTFQWYSNTTATDTGGTLIAGQTSSSYQPASSNGINYYYVIITFPSGGCNTITSNVATITINALPVVTTTQAQTICSGSIFNVTPTNGSGNNLPVGTLYKWSAPTGTGFTGGSQHTTLTPSISQTLTNTTNAIAVATYQVTPVSNSCNGVPFQVIITINPKPVIPAQTKNICSGDTFTIIPTNTGSSIVPNGTTYSWSTPIVTGGITGGLSGNTASDISGTLINTTNVAQTATYTITPLSPIGNCTGPDFIVTVTVNPRPTINNMSGSACSGTTFTFTPVNGTDGIVPANTQYTWAAPASQTGISGLTSGTGNSITGNLTNSTTSSVIVQYVVTPLSGSCQGIPFTIGVTISPMPTVAAIANQTICNGTSTTPISFLGTINNTQFNWINNNTAIGLAASGSGDISAFSAVNTTTVPITATIIVTPVLNNCNGLPQTFTITVNPAPVVIFSSTNQTICSGTASALVNLTSTSPNTTISWSAVIPTGITGMQTSGSTIIPAQTLVNTTSSPIIISYTAIAATADASACPGTPSIYTITVNPVPFVNTTQQTSICSGVPLNFVPIDGGGNNMPLGTTFTWSVPTGTGFTGGSVQTTAQTALNQTLVNTTINPVTATYIVTPKFGGCTGVPFTVQVTINPVAVLPNSSIILCSGSTFTFNPEQTATLFPAGTQFNWSIPLGNTTGGTSGTAQTVITGTLTSTTSTVQNTVYTITPVSPMGNCAGNPFTLTIKVNPTFSVGSTVSNYNGFQISSAGANDGFINLTPVGGTGTYTYTWTGPNGYSSTSQNINNLAKGDYSVTINDGLCAAIILQFHITEPLSLVIQEVLASHINVACFGQSTGIIEVEITQASIAPFDYALILLDGTIVENVLNSTALNYVFDNLQAGTYNIRVTDANGIMKFINSIKIEQPETGLTINNAIVSNFNGFSISCNGAHNGSINLIVSGGYPGYTFSWTGPGFTATTEDISNLNPGVYTVMINDSTNSCPITQSYTITEPQPVSFTGIISNFNGFGISCFNGNNGSITVTPAGGTGVYSYAWTGSDNFTATSQNLTNIKAGTYQLTVTDNNGCAAAVQSFTLTQPTTLSINEIHTNILCFGHATGAINVTVTGGLPDLSGAYTYAWIGPNGFASSSKDLIDVIAGTYNLIVTDSNGCTIPLSVVIIQQPEIIITPVTTPISCYGANDASITLSIIGGNPPYTAQWNNLATGTFQDNLAAGNYVITITDESNCTKEITVVIPEAPIFTVNPVFKHITCNGANDGSITLNLTGGIAPVTLVWSDGSTAGTQRNNLAPGTYTATITDDKPCQIVRTFTIIEPAKLTVGANITHALDCNNTSSGAIDLLVAGGTPPYIYTWSNGSTIEDLTAITSGTYSVTVTDVNNCSVNNTYTITRPTPITLNVTNNVVFNCDTKQVQQVNTAQASGGVPPFHYTWSSGTVMGTNGQSMTTNQNGTVIITATDASGCTGTQSFNVDTQRLGDAAFSVSSYASVTYNIFSIFDPIQFENQSTGDYTDFSWNFGDGSVSNEENPTHSYVKEGTYIVTLTVIYPYGCIDVSKITLIITKGYDVMIPNAFTPNGDGTNDTFSAVHKGLKSIELNIYDTWGSVIYYEKGDVIRGWDGSIKGIPSENGNYYYHINAETFYGQTVSYDGPFVLIK